MADPIELFQFHSSINELIPGLPHDLAMECLLRVPITSHPTLRLVSHQWKSTISNPSFFSLRRISNFAENHLFLIQPLSQSISAEKTTIFEESDFMDIDIEDNKQPSNGIGLPNYNLNIYNAKTEEWRCLSGLTIPTFSQCVVLSEVGKLVVLGGWDPTTLEPVSRVVVIDLNLGVWKEGSPMPTARSFFAVGAPGSTTVYVAGGHDGQKNALKSAEEYDVEHDQWKKIPPLTEERDECYGLSIFDDGKFWVISGYGTESQGRFRSDCEVFDPEKEEWSIVTGVWPYPMKNPKSSAVVKLEGKKKWWDVNEGEVMEYDWEMRVWKGLNNMGGIPKGVNGWVSLIDVGNGKICVMGNGENSDGERMFMLEMEEENGKMNWRWIQVETPPRFLRIPFSAAHFLM
ncbi:F-box/kelch-repeat protein SKIP20-like [Amaranthus tricolor]|uniref:F-box/kelch-repeat protein SKIP20-like n=1 Tax=Amaranthus tricolor TaxID=29722 RepID=UPI002590EFC1|nr:F-box/kelch-repeat protein SKIP20-like [Amaranthus tricolor]